MNAITPATRVEVIGNATLYLGDCRDVLPTLAGVSCVITDPPYSANTHAMAKTNKGAGHGTKLVTFGHMTDADFDDAIHRCLTIATGWVVATCDYRHAARLIAWEQFVRLGAWVKPNPMPQISADRPGQGFETVVILHAGVDKKQWNRGGGAGVWTYPVINNAEVPTQKPLPLVQAFIADFTRVGDVVLDPFMGSGTTGVAAVKTGRQFVGIEVLPQHFEIACTRIREAQRQSDLFVPPVRDPDAAYQRSMFDGGASDE